MRLFLLLLLLVFIFVLVEGERRRKGKDIMKGNDRRSKELGGMINAARKKGARYSKTDKQGFRFRKKRERKEGKFSITVLEQQLVGIPVMGGEIADEQWVDHWVDEMSKDTGKKTGKKRKINKGRKMRGKFVDNIHPSVRRLVRRMNPSRALAKLKNTRLKNADFISNCSSEKYIFVHPINGKAQPAYFAKCFGIKTDDYIRAPHIIYNLRLKVLLEWDQTFTQAILTGPGGNDVTGIYNYGIEKPKLTVTNVGGGKCRHENPDVKMVFDRFNKNFFDGSIGLNTWPWILPDPDSYCPRFDCTATTSEWKGMATEYPNDYPASWMHTAPSQLNDGLYNLQRAIDLYKAWYNGSPFGQVWAWVDTHYFDGRPTTDITDNAMYSEFWYGGALFFGRGRYWFYPLVTALDVVAHELGHKFTTEHGSNVWNINHVMGALHESFADMAGKATEFFETGTVADWRVGYQVKKNLVLRCMNTPSTCDGSLDHVSQFDHANLPVSATTGTPRHKASGIFNKVFYLLSQEWAYKVWDAFDVFYWTNQKKPGEGGWSDMWTFYDAAEAVLTTLSELKDCWHNGYCYDWILEQELVDAFIEVGISCSFTGTGAGKIWDCVAA